MKDSPLRTGIILHLLGVPLMSREGRGKDVERNWRRERIGKLNVRAQAAGRHTETYVHRLTSTWMPAPLKGLPKLATLRTTTFVLFLLFSKTCLQPPEERLVLVIHQRAAFLVWSVSILEIISAGSDSLNQLWSFLSGSKDSCSRCSKQRSALKKKLHLTKYKSVF